MHALPAKMLSSTSNYPTAVIAWLDGEGFRSRWFRLDGTRLLVARGPSSLVALNLLPTPLDAVDGIFAKENGRGMWFSDQPEPNPSGPNEGGAIKPKLKLVK